MYPIPCGDCDAPSRRAAVHGTCFACALLDTTDLNGKPLRLGTRAQLRISECDLQSTPVNPDDWPAAWQCRRDIVGAGTHTGEIIHVAKSYAWIKPIGPVPPELQAPLSASNKEMRAAAKECGGFTGYFVFIAVTDIVDDDLVLEMGMKVSYKFYQDRWSVGGCEVTTAV